MRNEKIKSPGLSALLVGVVLGIVSVPTMLMSTDPNLLRKALVLAIAAFFVLSVGAIQFLSYSLRSEKSKQAYREKWASRALFHSLVLVAVSDGELNAEDVDYISKVYKKSFYKDVEKKEINKIAKQIYSDPNVFLKDIKLYSNRIEPLMREHIIKSCIRLAAERKDMSDLHAGLKKLSRSLRIKSDFFNAEVSRYVP